MLHSNALWGYKENLRDKKLVRAATEGHTGSNSMRMLQNEAATDRHTGSNSMRVLQSEGSNRKTYRFQRHEDASNLQTLARKVISLVIGRGSTPYHTDLRRDWLHSPRLLLTTYPIG
ncbi:hypothetical protein RRG08_058477 [Elysia crispata]|uniref:Uncharacterized protein n=1 Tax=Elysia crispata TaxID=231223 RepID=A0AAE0Y644_9GAST|nr:hypothetical protein RRG08_058477 [Elysia crispata]